MGRANHIGTLSLCLALAGMVALELALAFELVAGVPWRILATGFEAATVGACADWFAVSALFRRIPLPLLGRHTNILVKHRARFSAAIVDMVENRWLAPASVSARLAGVSASQELLALFESGARRRMALDALRGALAQFAQGLDSSELARSVQRALEKELQAAAVAPVLGRWLARTVREGGQAQLGDVLFAGLERTLAAGRMHSIVSDLVARSLERYGSEGWLKSLGLRMAQKFGLLDADTAVASIVGEIESLLAGARGDRGHPLRAELDRALLHFAGALERSDPASVEALDTLMARMLEHAGSTGMIQSLLASSKRSALAQLADRDSELARALAGLVDRMLADLRADETLRARLDQWVRATIGRLVEEHHHLLGEIVAQSLAQLKDGELVEQVRQRVWNDLQYIRLNGAIVGGLVGIVLATLKWLLER